MNREEILRMEAGRELDSEVNFLIFGYDTKPPEYSILIEEAWEVVEALHEKHFTLVRLPEGGTYSVCFNGKVVVVCDTAPEAICKAALLAIMENKSEGGGGE